MKDKDILDVTEKNQTDAQINKLDQQIYSHQIKIDRKNSNNDWCLA